VDSSSPSPFKRSSLQVIQWTVTDCDHDEHVIGNAISQRRRNGIPVTLPRIHTSDFVEHQSLEMRLDLPVNRTQQRDGIYWSHLSYISISMKKIFIDFCRHATLPQKFEDCTVRGDIVSLFAHSSNFSLSL
jgi:hypothetical protein